MVGSHRDVTGGYLFMVNQSSPKWPFMLDLSMKPCDFPICSIVLLAYHWLIRRYLTSKLGHEKEVETDELEGFRSVSSSQLTTIAFFGSTLARKTHHLGHVIPPEIATTPSGRL